MGPAQLRAKIVSERILWVRQMMDQLKLLPLETYAAFHGDPRNSAAAESYLRRGLEALMDLGRHILAKGFGYAATEYKQIPQVLEQMRVLTTEEASLMRELAGYRNRMVHFYHEISLEELYEIASKRAQDIEQLLNAIGQWIKSHPEKIDRSL